MVGRGNVALEVVGVGLLVIVLLVSERVKLPTFSCHLGEIVLSDLFSRSVKILHSIAAISDRVKFSIFMDCVEKVSYSVPDVNELFDDIWVDVSEILRIGGSIERFWIDDDAEFEDPAVLDCEGKVGAVGDGDEVAVFIFVLEKEIVVSGDDGLEDSLHHEDKLVVGQIVVMDGDSSDVGADGSFDDELAG